MGSSLSTAAGGAAAWRAVEREEFVTGHRDAIDLAFSLEQDTWNGERYLQLSVGDFKAPA